MGTKRAVGLVMAKMALADGEVSDEERGFLEPVLPEGEPMEDIIREAKGLTLAQLVESVDLYADKFFIAMRAAAMAHIDFELDAREEALLERLLKVLELTPGDVEIMHQSVEDMQAACPGPPHPRVEELFKQSSFAAS